MTERLQEIPSDWGADILANLIKEITSGDWGKESETGGLVECDVIRGTDFLSLSKKDFTNVPRRFIKKSSLEKRTLQDGDILVELSGGSKDQPTGRVLLITEQLLSLAKYGLLYSNFVKRLKVNSERIHPKFLEHFWSFLYVNGVTRIYEKRTTGIRNFKLSDFLEKESVPLPPLPEQKAIAQILSTVQRTKEATEQVIQTTKELKKSLMKHLFTYGAVSLEETPNVKLKETEIGMVPEEWEQSKLDDILKLSSGKSRPKDVKNSASGEYIYPIYGGNGILGYSSEYFLEDTTLVLGRVGEYCGSVHQANGKSWISDNALYIKQILSDSVTMEFLRMCLELLDLNRYKKKSGQPLITQNIVCSKTIAYPKKVNQKLIVEMLGQAEKKIIAESNKRTALEQLFKTLLNNLMTGKIRVKNFEVPEA